jgi:hypothetical protein
VHGDYAVAGFTGLDRKAGAVHFMAEFRHMGKAGEDIVYAIVSACYYVIIIAHNFHLKIPLSNPPESLRLSSPFSKGGKMGIFILSCVVKQHDGFI